MSTWTRMVVWRACVFAVVSIGALVAFIVFAKRGPSQKDLTPTQTIERVRPPNKVPHGLQEAATARFDRV